MVSEDCSWFIYRNVFRVAGIIREFIAVRKTSTHTLIYVPDYQLVIVATTGKLKAVWAPFETTNLLFMPFKSANQTIRHSNVVVENHRIKRPTTEHIWTVPCQ